MFKRIEFEGTPTVIVQNIEDDKNTTLIIISEGNLALCQKQEVVDLISTLHKALEFWEYDG